VREAQPLRQKDAAPRIVACITSQSTIEPARPYPLEDGRNRIAIAIPLAVPEPSTRMLLALAR
jgi:hypothetical protein